MTESFDYRVLAFDYNVWNETDEADIDHWTEDREEAERVADEYHRTTGRRPGIVRYPIRTAEDGTTYTDTTTGERIQ